MKWYRHLYMGKTAKKKKYQIVWKIKHRAGLLDTYVITLASNENNLLDIMNSSVLLQPYYKKNSVFIVGIACGYEEALEVIQEIISEVYEKTGFFDVRSYLLTECGKLEPR